MVCVERRNDLVKFIQQRTAHDCGIAALAMFCDLTYDEVASSFPFNPDDPANVDLPHEGHNYMGLHPQEAYQFILSRGIVTAYLETSTWYTSFIGQEDEISLGRFSQSSLLTSMKLKRLILQERLKALVVVDSWREDGDVHTVCYDNVSCTVYDPHHATPGILQWNSYTPYLGIVAMGRDTAKRVAEGGYF